MLGLTVKRREGWDEHGGLEIDETLSTPFSLIWRLEIAFLPDLLKE